MSGGRGAFGEAWGGSSSLDPLLLRLSQVRVNTCRCPAHRCEDGVGGSREGRGGREGGEGDKKQGWKGRVGAQTSGVYAFRRISLLLFLRSTSTMKTCTSGFMQHFRHAQYTPCTIMHTLEFGRGPEPDCCHWQIA